MTETPEPASSVPQRIEQFPLKPPPRFALRGVGSIAVLGVIAAGALAQALAGTVSWPLLVAIVGALVLLPIATLLFFRRPPPPSVIELLPDRLHLPIVSGTGTVPVRYRDLTSLLLRDEASGFLTVGTILGSFVFPVASFVNREDPKRLEQLIRERLLLLPDGVQRLETIDKKGDQAARTFAHPLSATVVVLALLVIAFGIEQWGGAFEQAFSLVRFGAAARFLVLDGQWYRIFTASLLHANELHLLVNGLAIWSLGGAIERLYGSRNFLLVYLAGAVTGALLSVLSDRAEMSVGASTAAFGLLGAFAFTSFRYRDRMPTGFQPPFRWWVVVLGLNLGLSLFIRVIDFPAHLGGFLGGVVVSAFLLDGDQELPLRGRPPWWALIATALLVLFHVGAVGLAIRAFARGEADEERLMQSHLERDRGDSDSLNALAWMIAIDPKATEPRLRLAYKAALRSLEKLELERRERMLEGDADAIGKMVDFQRWMTTDTVATVEYRLGDLDAAVRREIEVVRTRNESGIATQLARFMAARVARDGPLVEPALGPVRTSSLGVSLGYESSRGFFVNIAPTAPIPEVITAFGLVEAQGKLVGLLEMTVEPRGAEPRRIWLEQQNIFAAWPKDATMTIAYLTKAPLKGWFGWSMDKVYLAYP